MDIDSLTIRQAREIAAAFAGTVQREPCPFSVGSAYLIRTVTMAWTGRVRAIVGAFLVLDHAAWIADTGRFHLATESDRLNEVEPVGDGVIVGLGSIVDAKPWTTPLPSAPK